MSSRMWYFLSGLALLFGGPLTFVFTSILAQIVTSSYKKSLNLDAPTWLFLNLMVLLGTVLIVVGLPAVYARLAKQVGWSGLVGFVLTLVAILMTGVFGGLLFFFHIPFLNMDMNAMLTGEGTPVMDLLFIGDSLLFSVGTILFGIATARTYPTGEFAGVGVLFIIAGLFNVTHLVPIGGSFWDLDYLVSGMTVAIFDLGLAAFGFVLMTSSEVGPWVRRPLLYGTLTVSVVTGYVLVVGSIGALVQQTRVAFIISLVVIGLIAILVQPLRDRLQRAVNRLVYGERDNPYAVLSRLGKHMEATLAPESVLPTIVETIARSLKLPYAAIVLKQDDELTIAAAYGSQKEEQQRFPLVYQAEQLGELVLSPRSPGEPLTPADQRLLHDLAPQIGVAVNAVRLTVDLQRSRERLVTTREEERRRLRRDLHDGLGPQLASQTLTLTAARKLLRDDPDAAEALLVNATVHVQEAITDIRRLVYDLRPPALDDLGLIAALREQIAQYQSSGVSFTLDVPDQLPELSAAVEVACYRIIQEALTNVVRHSHARICTIQIALNGVLILEISDDGTGLTAACRPGVGFSSMRERAEELGGSCVIESIPAGGTRVSAQLPL
jgi:signal transduction histidine kinase